ncbi:NAD(P)H azoreductase-like [Oscarella lobularis]|uniref:NAD(P)H azoreductase-like n=1 Tax=Oscarella lobularis TaxID=121494 RepID=UPI003313DE21
MGKPVILVLGASGNIGAATVKSLSKHADKFDIRAGVRSPEKATALRDLAGVTVVQADMGKKAELVKTLAGVDRLFIVTPGHIDRAPLTIGAAEAAKEAGVKFVLVVSVPTVVLPETVFAKQCGEIEQTIPRLGIAYSFIRLPMFIDNHFGSVETIKGQGLIYAAAEPDKYHVVVAVSDAGSAATAILADPTKHEGKTYTVASDGFTHAELASAFSEALGKEVKYVQVPYEAAKEAILKMGILEWQGKGLVELYETINAGHPALCSKDHLVDYEKITGQKATSMKEWLKQVAGAFK